MAAWGDRPAAPAPWLPPLPASVTLDELDELSPTDQLDERREPESPDYDPCLAPATRRGLTAVAVALADEPAHQRRRVVDWSPAHGHLLVVGRPGSGTSTALATAAAALARAHPPGALHLYAVTDDTPILDPVASLPHTGAVIRPGEQRRQQRLVTRLVDELDARRVTGVTSPAVVALIDDLPGLLRRFDTLQGHRVVDQLMGVCRDGPALGLHLAVAADRPGTVPATVLASCTTRLVLALADPLDAATLGVRALPDPAAPPGRGVTGPAPGTELQVALPGSTRRADPGDTCAPISGAAGPPPLGDLPLTLPTAQLPVPVWDGTSLDLRIGRGDRRLEPVGWRLGPGQHALVTGPARSGRTTALVTVAGLAAAADRARPSRLAVVALAGRGSPLTQVDNVAVAGSDRGCCAPIGAHGAADCLLVLVDDADRRDDRSGVLMALIEGSRPGLLVIAAVRSDRIRRSYGHWTQAVRASGCGLALAPDADRDDELWGVRLPDDPEVRRAPGRGVVVADGRAEIIQVATTDRSMPDPGPGGRPR